MATFVDLKSPYMLGHARAVSELVADAGQSSGLAGDELITLRRAGLVHGLGRLGVSNSIWDKQGPLGAGEWERVRMQPYLTERMLRQSSALASLGLIAVQLRERLDGSGYPRGLSGGSDLTAGAHSRRRRRVPGDVRTATSPRGTPSNEAAVLSSGRRSKRDAWTRVAVEAVLAAAGHRVPRRREGPAGLTAREIDVLRLVARGMSHKQIATQLVISPKTARNHIEHIYAKIGVTNRTAAEPLRDAVRAALGRTADDNLTERTSRR